MNDSPADTRTGKEVKKDPFKTLVTAREGKVLTKGKERGGEKEKPRARQINRQADKHFKDHLGLPRLMSMYSFY